MQIGDSTYSGRVPGCAKASSLWVHKWLEELEVSSRERLMSTNPLAQGSLLRVAFIPLGALEPGAGMRSRCAGFCVRSLKVQLMC